MIQLTDKVFVFDVPEEAENFRVLSFSQPNTFSYDYSITKGERVTKGLIAMIDLPFPGNWRYICTSKEVTEDQAAQVVERHGDGWIDYDNTSILGCYPYLSSIDSLNSFLASKGLDPVSKNYCLIEKQDQ